MIIWQIIRMGSKSVDKDCELNSDGPRAGAKSPLLNNDEWGDYEIPLR